MKRSRRRKIVLAAVVAPVAIGGVPVLAQRSTQPKSDPGRNHSARLEAGSGRRARSACRFQAWTQGQGTASIGH